MPPFWRSPQAIFMVIAGLALAVLGPYLMWRNSGPHSKLSGTATQETADAQPGELAVDPEIDVMELEGLPKSLHDGAMLLLTTDTPEHPDSIVNLSDPTSDDLLHPVTEAVFETQPTLYWQPGFGPPPYSVLVSLGTQLVAHGEGLTNLTWTVPTPLPRGGSYTWQLMAEGVSARASFRILDDAQSKIWTAVQADHAKSHLAMGTVAQQLGMLGIAEREFTALVKDHPQSETAMRLLSNVQELRER
jgi:hypothetical protein